MVICDTGISVVHSTPLTDDSSATTSSETSTALLLDNGGDADVNLKVEDKKVNGRKRTFRARERMRLGRRSTKVNKRIEKSGNVEDSDSFSDEIEQDVVLTEEEDKLMLEEEVHESEAEGRAVHEESTAGDQAHLENQMLAVALMNSVVDRHKQEFIPKVKGTDEILNKECVKGRIGEGNQKALGEEKIRINGNNEKEDKVKSPSSEEIIGIEADKNSKKDENGGVWMGTRKRKRNMVTQHSKQCEIQTERRCTSKKSTFKSERNLVTDDTGSQLNQNFRNIISMSTAKISSVPNPVLPSSSFDEDKVKLEGNCNIEIDPQKSRDSISAMQKTPSGDRQANITTIVKSEECDGTDTVKPQDTGNRNTGVQIGNINQYAQPQQSSTSSSLAPNIAIVSKERDTSQKQLDQKSHVSAVPSPLKKHSNSVSFAVSPQKISDKGHGHATSGGNGGNCNNSSSLLARRRIFSIDLDPEGFDFELSMGVSCASPVGDFSQGEDNLPDIAPVSTLDHVENIKSELHDSTSSLPPVAEEDLIAKEIKATKEEDVELVIVPRDRGMSFELFAFGGNEDETLPSSLRNRNSSGGSNGRPRGDSIIFDPVSFTDGGIHEEKALLRSRRNSMSLEENDEIELMNTPGFVEGPISNNSHLPTPIPISKQKRTLEHILSTKNSASNKARKSVPIPSTIVHPRKTNAIKISKAASKPVQKNISPAQNIKPQISASQAPACSITASKSQATISVISGASNPVNTEETIHMPQGSAAAAAAAMSLPTQILPSSLNGTISHTACPMELLNKGGRIGIYLPEARRDRIAKFHSKRKMRIWRKRIKYDCRKKLADSRPRIKGRFVKSLEAEDEE